MTLPPRPDLSALSAEVRAYILGLEAELEAARGRQAAAPEQPPAELEPSEPPTTINVITATRSGLAKRTPRHYYSRQRRGGMGVFDLDSPEEDPPTVIALADESDALLLITDQARAFRLPAAMIPEKQVRARGEDILARFDLLNGESLAAILPVQAEGYIALAGRSGQVRLLRHHVFGDFMKPGTALYDPKTFGLLAGACWTPGDGDLFIVTRAGRAIRFSEKAVPPQGGLGIRLQDDDEVVSINAVYDDSGVFLLADDGKGTIRQMQGFSANKAPGAGGKTAIKADKVVGATAVGADDDLFILTRLGKIIRFSAAEVPEKEGVVQGVICITLRADEPLALASSPVVPGLNL
ncbi:MAG TPA: DNA gyrase C-terminal beta-propeller domain-containing protein [Anaerolineales bacterium]|nr:DNA gyrase C-terminal beta-propeller domain-containing protein [Anaerolineales bacterium]